VNSSIAWLERLTRKETWTWFSDVPLKILLTIVLAVATRWVLHRVIHRAVGLAISRGERADRTTTQRVFAHATGWDHDRHKQRLETLGTILRSAVTIVIGLIAILTVMALLGIPLAPLLASAGVGGVALGFGAQSLVKDFLSGIFMIMEDQYGVGDLIDTGVATGTVTDVSLRITTLRDGNGVTWHIRNGEILRVGNRSQGWAMTMVDLPIAYDATPEKAIRALKEMVAAFAADPDWDGKVLDVPEVLGVESIVGSTMILRVMAKCKAGEEFSVQRELRLLGKQALDRAGVPGPPVSVIPSSGGTP